MIDLGGFSFSLSTQKMMIAIFVIYSVVIVGLGLFVKLTSKSGSHLSSFVTGDGKASALEIGMMTATVSMAAGVMVGTPGLAYSVGMVHSLCMSAFFLSSFVTLGTFGRKFPIMKNRIGASTICQLMQHRYQSKGVAAALALIGAMFCTVLAGGQLSGAARIFSLISGGHYNIGLLIAIACVVAYTYTGGVKSLARVSVIQGFIMLTAVIAIGYAEFHQISLQYGSVQAGFEMLSRVEGFSERITTDAWSPLYALGVAVVNSWSVTGIPATMQSTMYYDNPKAMKHGMVISLVVSSLIMAIMCVAGPLASILNQNLAFPDLTVLYISTNFLPSWMSGIVVCGIFAAVQSSIAGYLIFIGASVASDLYKGVLKPETPEKTVSKLNKLVIVLVVIAATMIAIHPVDLVQTLLIFGAGCCGAAFIFPAMLGAYWGKATAPAAISAIIGGPLAYVAVYFLEQNPAFAAAVHSIHPMLISAAVSLGLMIIVSLCTQKQKVPYGVYRVWFCKDYDETFARMYDGGKSRK